MSNEPPARAFRTEEPELSATLPLVGHRVKVRLGASVQFAMNAQSPGAYRRAGLPEPRTITARLWTITGDAVAVVVGDDGEVYSTHACDLCFVDAAKANDVLRELANEPPTLETPNE